MHPLPGLPFARYHEFVNDLSTQAPRVAAALTASAPVVKQALLGVQAGVLRPDEASQQVLAQLPSALPRKQARPAKRRVEMLFKGEAQSLRSDRVRLLVAQRLASSITTGYRSVLDSQPGAVVFDREFAQALRRLCSAVAVLTPPSATTLLMGEKVSLEQQLKDVPRHFLRGPRDSMPRADVIAVMNSLQSEMGAVVKGDTRVQPGMLRHEVKMAEALRRQFCERAQQLQDAGRAGMSVPELQGKCEALLEDLLKGVNVRLAAKGSHPVLAHPVTRFVEQEHAWVKGAKVPSRFQLTEAMTRVRVVLNAFAAESFNAHEARAGKSE